MLAQIVADTLGVPYDCIEVNAADTGVVPDSGPTVASRTCMVVGRILQRCAEEMRARLGRPDAAPSTCGSTARCVITKQYERPADIVWDDDTYRGDAYGSYGWACDVVEVEVDPRHLGGAAAGVHDRARDRQGDPSAARRRARSKAARAGHRLGAARRRRHARRPDGERQLTNYIIPTTLDTPAMRRRDAREPVPARSVRREGRRRDADGRPGAGRRQCAARRRRASMLARDSRRRPSKIMIGHA